MIGNISKGEVMFATVDDIPGWIMLVDFVKDNFPGFEKESYLATLRKNIARKTALCYKDNGNIVGILLFSPNQNCLSCLAVHPDYRCIGIASKLIDRMLVLLSTDRDITVTTFREGDEKGIAPRKLYKKLVSKKQKSLRSLAIQCRNLYYAQAIWSIYLVLSALK